MNSNSNVYKLKNLASNITLSNVTIANKKIKSFLLIFLTLLVVGLFLSILIPASWSSFYLFSSRNFINRIFAYKGNLIFTILYVSISFAKFIDFRKASNMSQLKKISLLPLPNALDTKDSKRLVTSGKKILTIQLVKFTLKNVILYLDFWVIDHIFVWTGGACDLDTTAMNRITDAEKCRKLSGKWEGGFDISGHFCFLTSVSLILFYEIHEICRFYENNDYRDFSPFTKSVVSAMITTLYLWCCLLFVTSIFYHTLMEKILGLAMGYICSSVIYSITRLSLVK